ncbi:MAG: DUF4293 domain-containing protein [Paludibacter sp.]|nr:DUF4293 domain-containing protein [Paludibacter sp.]MDD4198792.1 DUF4293 domain-containing protein [Paludibacter sp.]MDD4427508.1 DUF4293 domain-containing protein [Paludibacter sp.]
MIQRIQTFYLFLVVVLTSVTFFLPVAGLQNLQQAMIYEISYLGLFEINISGKTMMANTWILTALMAIIPVLSFITILLFKKRLLQIRLIIFNLVLMAGFYGLLFIYLWQFGKALDASSYLEIPAAFPLVSIILSIMAIRAIGKDEALIKSLNRIR